MFRLSTSDRTKGLGFAWGAIGTASLLGGLILGFNGHKDTALVLSTGYVITALAAVPMMAGELQEREENALLVDRIRSERG